MPVTVPGVPRTAASIVELIGNTPLIRLSSFEAGLRNVELYAKAEWRNPGGSVKDRAAARMILEGERSGRLTKDKIILDATSGNTGIAYAMIGAARGYRVRLCVPENVTPERKKILKAFGADVVFTDPMQGSDGAILRVKALYAERPDLYFYPDQYNNEFNWRAHYDTTAPEIIEQTSGRLTHFIAGLEPAGASQARRANLAPAGRAAQYAAKISRSAARGSAATWRISASQSVGQPSDSTSSRDRPNGRSKPPTQRPGSPSQRA